MLNNIMKRLKTFFSDEENQNNEEVHVKGTSYTFSSDEVEGKVQNIYPKAGAYRFPIELRAEDLTSKRREENRGTESKKENSKNVKVDSNTRDSAVRTQSNGEKNQTKSQKVVTSVRFQGNLTQSRVTPSPIYGYQKQEALSDVVNNKEKLNTEIHVEQEMPKDHENEFRQNEPIKEFQRELPTVAQSVYPTKIQSEIVSDMQSEQQPEIQNGMSNLTESEIHDIDIQEQVEVQTLPKLEVVQATPRYAEVRQIPVEKQFSSNYEEREQRVPYHFPQMSSLLQASGDNKDEDDHWIDQQASTLMETFLHFNLKAELIGVTQGPTVTRFEIQPAPGIKISKFTNLQDDLKLSLAAKEIRIEAPIPGKNAIGIEVPNRSPRAVHLGDILVSETFQKSESPLTICLGSDLSGDPVVTDIQKMPHGLIAGATGSGKSVCINSLLVSLLYKASPEQLRLLLIDPKVVELTPYHSIPHLVTPVVTDPKRATASLKWAVDEMERRYLLFADEGVRDLSRYNKVIEEKTGEPYALPYIVIVIDELADLMMVSPQDVEDSICRITQKARACGIHLIVATQRPSVDVITGLIKANIPTRLAFSVSSQVDSRTILDMVGAERLLGKGDMLFLHNGASKPIRVQGNFVSDDEIEQIISEVSAKDSQRFLFSQDDLLTAMQDTEMEDELIEEAAFFVMEQGTASASSLQRKFRIGYNRAARLIDWMEDQGIVTESHGSKPRNVIWSQEQFLEWLDRDSTHT